MGWGLTGVLLGSTVWAMTQGTLFQDDDGRLRTAFLEFHRDNPRVYSLLKQFAFQAIRAGHKNLGISLVVERVRWETSVVTNDPDFKINNNHRAYYARMFMDDHPAHDGFFRTRRLTSEAAP